MKICVIGLGNFGYSLATTLADTGQEVLAIDNNMQIVSSIKDKVTHALCMHVSNQDGLIAAGLPDVDTAIVAIGQDFAHAVLITALLKKKIGIKQVIARATTDLQKEILELVGADLVIMPEQETAQRVASELSSSK